MDKKLRRIVQDKLAGLPAGEVLPGFDPEALWDTLAQRLPPPERRLIPVRRRWIYAAAAGIAGLLIGGFAMKFAQQGPLPESAAVSAGKTQPAGIAVPLTTQPAGTAQPEAVAHPAAPAQAAVPERYAAAPVKQPAVRAVSPAQSVTPRAETGVPEIVSPGPQPQPVVAQTSPAAPPRQRAIHLLDLESEDHTVLLNNAPRKQPGVSFSLYISPARLPEGRDGIAPSSVLRPAIR